MSQLLLVTIFLPLAGALAMACLAPLGRNAVRWTALVVAIATLALAGTVVNNFPADGASAFASSEIAWVGPGAGLGVDSAGDDSAGAGKWLPDVRFSVGLDGLGVWLFGLSALLLLTSVLVSWDAIQDRPALFYGMLLLLESGCLGVFAARDLLLFYIFFEFTLIPLFFLIGIWGSEDRRYAAIKFFLFTLAGSVLTFLGLLAIVIWDAQHSGNGLRFSIEGLTQGLAAHPLPESWQIWIFLALFAGFAIKVPLFPLHTWLPLAHVQAPTAGSVFLAGVLLKIGTYGFLRFNIPWLPAATAAFMPWMLLLSVVGIVYGALIALAQRDMKRLIAYSSVSHLGFCMLGLFAINRLGIQGGTLQMINHGLSTGGLFAIVGMLYERYHTREISQLGGLARRLPWLSLFMLIFTFSSIGLPGLNGFPGEFMILIGMFQRGFVETAGVWQSACRRSPSSPCPASCSALGTCCGSFAACSLARSRNPTATAMAVSTVVIMERMRQTMEREPVMGRKRDIRLAETMIMVMATGKRRWARVRPICDGVNSRRSRRWWYSSFGLGCSLSISCGACNRP